jgi:hypothetical protein
MNRIPKELESATVTPGALYSAVVINQDGSSRVIFNLPYPLPPDELRQALLEAERQLTAALSAVWQHAYGAKA